MAPRAVARPLRLDHVAAGDHTLLVQASGYAPISRTITVAANGTAMLDLVLSPAAGGPAVALAVPPAAAPPAAALAAAAVVAPAVAIDPATGLPVGVPLAPVIDPATGLPVGVPVAPVIDPATGLPVAPIAAAEAIPPVAPRCSCDHGRSSYGGRTSHGGHPADGSDDGRRNHNRSQRRDHRSQRRNLRRSELGLERFVRQHGIGRHGTQRGIERERLRERFERLVGSDRVFGFLGIHGLFLGFFGTDPPPHGDRRRLRKRELRLGFFGRLWSGGWAAPSWRRRRHLGLDRVLCRHVLGVLGERVLGERLLGRHGCAGRRQRRGRGTLVIQTLPWARVFLDGRDTGRNTPVRELSSRRGRIVSV
jgi:hypothetical protein